MFRDLRKQVRGAPGNRTLHFFMEKNKYFKSIVQKILSLFNLRLSKIIAPTLPIEVDKQIINFINISSKLSMTGHQRMYLLSQAILNVKENNLEGDFVECGVWRGGEYTTI